MPLSLLAALSLAAFSASSPARAQSVRSGVRAFPNAPSLIAPGSPDALNLGLEPPPARDPFVVGVETEYSLIQQGRVDLELPKAADYPAMLEVVQRSAGGEASDIQSKGFGKHDSGLTQAFYTDPQGRKWKAVPELLNRFALLASLAPEEVGRQFDGVELVAPPLRSGTPDEDMLIDVHRKMLESGRFGRGILSATQFTFGAERLMDAGGNISRLVDAILFLESNWKEVYSAVNPVRMGTLVNHYSVPLAANQKELLEELSALTPERRTFKRVREIFQKYEPRELELAGGDANAAWKYRAMNYKKLFGLMGAEQTPLVELRIADFASGADLRRIPKLLSAIFGGRLPAKSPVRFKDPFAELGPAPSFGQLNDAILGLSRRRYRGFLRRLGLSSAQFPKLGRLGSFAPGTGRLQVLERAIRDVAPEILEALGSPLGALRLPVDEAVYATVEAALSQDSLTARRFGALALFGLNEPRYEPLMRKALRDPDPGVRYSAASALRLLRP